MALHSRLYHKNHRSVHEVRGSARQYKCQHCDRQAFDWATIAGADSEDAVLDPWSDFIPLCRKCHRAYDRSMPDWTGKHHTPEAIEKIRQAKQGHQNHTPESRQKISKALTGIRRSPETVEKMRQARAGVTFSDEARQNMSAGQRRRWANAENRTVHGTTTAYRKGCRCDDCRAAVTAAARHRRTRGLQ